MFQPRCEWTAKGWPYEQYLQKPGFALVNLRSGEYTVCSEEKYELPRGSINAVNANKWQITKHYPKEIPWLTSYFSEEYTAYYSGTTQHKKCETVI